MNFKYFEYYRSISSCGFCNGTFSQSTRKGEMNILNISRTNTPGKPHMVHGPRVGNFWSIWSNRRFWTIPRVAFFLLCCDNVYIHLAAFTNYIPFFYTEATFQFSFCFVKFLLDVIISDVLILKRSRERFRFSFYAIRWRSFRLPNYVCLLTGGYLYWLVDKKLG